MRYYGTVAGPSLFPLVMSLLPVLMAGGFLGYWLASAQAGARFLPAVVLAESLAILAWLGAFVVDIFTNRHLSTFLIEGLFALVILGLPAFLIAAAVGGVVGWCSKKLNTPDD